MATSKCGVFGFIVSLCALLFNVISIATTHWLNAEKYLKMTIGLFRHCDTHNKYCGGMDQLSPIVDVQELAWFRVIQATFLLAALGTLLTVALALLVLVNFFDSKGTYKVIASVNMLTLMSECISITLFAFYYKQIFVIVGDESSAGIGYSFYVAIAACVLLFVAFIFHAIEACHAAEVLRNMQHRFTVWTTPYTLFIEQEQ